MDDIVSQPDLDALLGAHYAAKVMHRGNPAEAMAAILRFVGSEPGTAAGRKRLEELEALCASCGGEPAMAQRCSVSLVHLRALREALP